MPKNSLGSNTKSKLTEQKKNWFHPPTGSNSTIEVNNSASGDVFGTSALYVPLLCTSISVVTLEPIVGCGTSDIITPGRTLIETSQSPIIGRRVVVQQGSAANAEVATPDVSTDIEKLDTPDGHRNVYRLVNYKDY